MSKTKVPSTSAWSTYDRLDDKRVLVVLKQMRLECVRNAKRYYRLSETDTNENRKEAYRISHVAERQRAVSILRAIKILKSKQ